uniref:CD59 glycoprotein n=1 Tax=Neolamprologus brichardi TaxID=32507 RepID=A0A3Q4HC39_NEOBR
MQCYSCPGGSSQNCAVKQECSQGKDSCLKLTSGKTYTECLRYADCDFMTLAVRYSVPDFTFSCCQKTLCNETCKISSKLKLKPTLSSSLCQVGVASRVVIVFFMLRTSFCPVTCFH